MMQETEWKDRKVRDKDLFWLIVNLKECKRMVKGKDWYLSRDRVDIFHGY